MKNLLKITFGLLLVSIVFMGCSDDSTTTPKNYIEYDNTQYDLSQGFMVTGDSLVKSASVETIGHPIVLMLMSSGFTIHEANGSIDSITGDGSAIAFQIYSGSSDAIDEGEYKFDSLSLAQPGTFSYADAVLNYNADDETGTEVEMNSGTLSVKKSNDDYEFTFDCTGYNGKKVTGYYKGAVKVYSGTGDVFENKVQQVFGWDFKPDHP